MSNCHDAYTRVKLLIEPYFEGKLGHFDNRKYTEFDWCFIKLCYGKAPDLPFDHDDVMPFIRAVEDGQLDLGWLFGPHALTLLKAKIIQTPEVHPYFPEIAGRISA